jgi:hypothetical protein
LASIYKPKRLRNGRLDSPCAADSAAVRDSSYSTSRHASPRGLGYSYSTTWEAACLKSISGHILQDDPSIREEVLDSRLGGSMPRVLRFFLSGFFGIFLPRLQMDPEPEPAAQSKARGLLHTECDFANHTSISAAASRQGRQFLKTFEGSLRGRLGLLEKTSRLLKHQLEYIPASGCFDYS